MPDHARGTIAILTGGGDVPGLNPAIRAVTLRALREDYRVLGIRRGWAGLLEPRTELGHTNDGPVEELTERIVNEVGRSGGTFLHTSRTNPAAVKRDDLPMHLADRYREDVNDLTPEIVANLASLGVDHLIPIGGDDTLSYGLRLHNEGVKVVGIPKTMDNDVPGTDYCIGFSTCVTRTIELANRLRTSAGSHERFLVLEVFGRYAGYTALLPAMAGASSRCVIPEHRFDMERLTELLCEDRDENPNRYAVVLVSEGAMFEGARPEGDEMIFDGTTSDAYGHRKLGGVGDLVADELQRRSPLYNGGRSVNVLNQKLGYLARSGDPDAVDSIVPMAFGNMALDLILSGQSGRLLVLRDGRYDHAPLEVVTAPSKRVDVDRHYNRDRLRPHYQSFEHLPLFIMHNG
jgi:ATP-dependent phosphofructokinase / diphosphate-dependent phosphofructokinase